MHAVLAVMESYLSGPLLVLCPWHVFVLSFVYLLESDNLVHWCVCLHKANTVCITFASRLRALACQVFLLITVSIKYLSGGTPPLYIPFVLGYILLKTFIDIKRDTTRPRSVESDVSRYTETPYSATFLE